MFYYISSIHQFKLSFIIQHLNCFLICLQRKDLTVGVEYLYSTDTNVQATWLCKMFNIIWCNVIDRIWRNSVNVQLQKYNTVLSFGSKILCKDYGETNKMIFLHAFNESWPSFTKIMNTKVIFNFQQINLQPISSKQYQYAFIEHLIQNCGVERFFPGWLVY